MPQRRAVHVWGSRVSGAALSLSSSADDDAPIQPVIQAAGRLARTCAARATWRLIPEPGEAQVNPAVAESLNGGAHGPGNGVHGVNGAPGNGVAGNGVAAPMTKEEQVKM